MAAKQKNKMDSDVIIVGGGHAGLSLAGILAAHDIDVICVDRDDPKTAISADFDGRTTAISFGSRHVMKAAGAWDAIAGQACPIEDIHILDDGSAVLLDFLVGDVEGEAFGWIVENNLLRKNLHERVKSLKTAQHIAPAKVDDFSRDEDSVCVHLSNGNILRAPLVIGADGRFSFTREWMGIKTRGWRYNQRAIVCTVTHENPHHNVAVEHFRAAGPFAILPMQNDADGNHRSSVVWTEHGPENESALKYDDKTFNIALTARFPESYGAVKLAGKRFSFPLGLSHAHEYIAPRMALIADAAHAIHPIAGQGLNMGLRDVAAIAELIINAKKAGTDIGSDSLLQEYQRQRRFDNMSMAATTDALNRLFSNDITPVRILRRAGLRAVERIKPAKRFFMKQAMGASGLLPRLVKTGKLD